MYRAVQKPVQLTNCDCGKEDGTMEVVCGFPADKRKVREGRVPDPDPGPVTGNVSKSIGRNNRARNDAVGLRISVRYHSDRTDVAGAHAQLERSVSESNAS